MSSCMPALCMREVTRHTVQYANQFCCRLYCRFMHLMHTGEHTFAFAFLLFKESQQLATKVRCELEVSDVV